jgi:copper ion binding protein
MKRILFITLALSLFIGAYAFACDGAKATAGACSKSKGTTAAAMASATEGQKSVTLKVSNMTCNSCVNHVTKALAAVDGVSDVKVSLEKGTAEVQFAAAKVQPDMLTASVVKAGYPAEFADAVVTPATKAGCDPSACTAHAKMAGAKDGKCDPAACAKMVKDGKCDPDACAKMAKDGKCDPAACATAKMASATDKPAGAACDVQKAAACAGDKK